MHWQSMKDSGSCLHLQPPHLQLWFPSPSRADKRMCLLCHRMTPMRERSFQIKVSDPQGADALTLLHEATLEARALYSDLHDPSAPFPTNPPTPPRGIYLLVYDDTRPVGSGALRPLDESTVEIRRMYVLKEYRRHGVAMLILEALEREAARLQYRSMRLETGKRQLPAMRLYEAYGFTRIPPFGPYVNDPISVCYEKTVQVGLESGANGNG